MKRILNKLCVVAAALVMVLTFTQCAKDTLRKNIFGKVEVSLTATKGDMTRTELEANGAEMTVTWSEGDKLYVVGATDGLLGYLTLKSGENTATATFGGTLDYLSAKQNVHFYYVGKNKEIKSGSDTYEFDLSKQAGTLDAIEDSLHVMYGTKDNVDPSTVNFGAVAFSNLISIVKVDTQSAFGEVSGIKLGGTCASASIDLKSATATPAVDTITLTGNASTSYYIALLSNGAQQQLTFNYDGLSRSINAKTIVQGCYYTNSGNAVALNEPFEFVDLGLSVLWANMNLGACSASDYGDYYAWGEVEPYHAAGYSKEDPVAHWRSMTTGAGNTDITGYNWHTYSQGGKTTFTEWTTKPYDESTYNLLPKFDAANYVIPGSHTPTLAEWKELKSNCASAWTTNYNGTGIQGIIFTSKVEGYTDKSIFLPVSGVISGDGHVQTGTHSSYMSSTRRTDNSENIYVTYIYNFFINAEYAGSRKNGFPVRAVKEKTAVEPEYIDLGVSVLWANINVGATAPEDFGNYYAWGELAPYYSSMIFNYTKESATFTWKDGKGSGYARMSYCGTSTFTEWDPVPYDSSNKLKPGYDVCTQIFDSESRMPTVAEWEELATNCKWTKLPRAYRVENKSDATKYIILPLAGRVQTTNYTPKDNNSVIEGRYWSSDFNSGEYAKGYNIKGNDTKDKIVNGSRTFGFTVRAVKEKPLPEPEFIDLGLPSGLLWANMNIGATAPEKTGTYFAWAEKAGKASYNWATYAHCNGTESTLTKYTLTDGLSVMESTDDPATVLYGDKKITTPTKAQYDELKANCDLTWEVVNGVNCFKFTSKTYPSKYIYLPAGGEMRNATQYVTDECQYWTSTLYTEIDADGNSRKYAYIFSVNSSMGYGSYDERSVGKTIRAVKGTIDGELPGIFSVGADKKIRFSQGNLQYIGSGSISGETVTTPYWRFATNQWDVLGKGPAASDNKGNVSYITSPTGYNQSTSNDACRDLFGWGCTGYQDTRTSDTQTYYQPYARNNTNAAYGPTYDATNKYGLTVANHSDWGYVEIRTSAGTTSPSGTWRTLTNDEWVYLLTTRTVNGGTGEGKSYQRTTLTYASGKSIYGLLILPDNFTGTVSSTTSASAWATLEKAGVVFLPGAGYRQVSTVYNVGNGDYWSSTVTNGTYANRVMFTSSDFKATGGNSKSFGCAVRLVRDLD